MGREDHLISVVDRLVPVELPIFERKDGEPLPLEEAPDVVDASEDADSDFVREEAGVHYCGGSTSVERSNDSPDNLDVLLRHRPSSIALGRRGRQFQRRHPFTDKREGLALSVIEVPA